MTDVLEDELKNLLKSVGLGENVCKQLVAMRCFSVITFANWPKDSSVAVVTALLASSETLKVDDAAQALLIMAHRKAEACIARTIKRTAEGLDAEHLDEPLESEAQRGMLATYKLVYRVFRIDPRDVCIDTQLARFRREFERRSQTLFEIAKAKPLASTQSAAPLKSRRLSEGISVQIEGEEDAEET